MSRASLLCLVVVVAACDSTTGPVPDGGGGGGGLTVSELLQRDQVIMHVEDLGDGRVGIITDVPAHTSTICPDCEAMNLSEQECPAACSRERLEWSVIDSTGTVVVENRVLRTFVPPWWSSYLGFVQAERLASGDVAMAWTLCEGPPARSCNAEYAVFTERGEPVVAPISLYKGLYGELTMTANREAGTVLIARSSDLVVRAGVWAAILTSAGQVLRPFIRIGSSNARAAGAVPDTDGFVVVAEDREPLADDAACPPCERLDTCIGPDASCSFGGRIAPEAGLWAYRFGADGQVTQEPIATGWHDDGLYYPHQTYRVARVPSGLAVASWWDLPNRRIVVRRRTADGWSGASTSLEELGVHPPVRWLGLMPGDGDAVHVFGEAIAQDADGVQPHAFLAAELGAGSIVSPRTIGPTFRGAGFGPTGDVGTTNAVVSAGIIDPDVPGTYAHWSVWRFTRE